MIFAKVIRFAAAALAVAAVTAHVDLSSEETAWYNGHVTRSTEALKQCLEMPELKDLHKRMVAERKETLHRIRKARGIETRGEHPLSYKAASTATNQHRNQAGLGCSPKVERCQPRGAQGDHGSPGPLRFQLGR